MESQDKHVLFWIRAERQTYFAWAYRESIITPGIKRTTWTFCYVVGAIKFSVISFALTVWCYVLWKVLNTRFRVFSLIFLKGSSSTRRQHCRGRTSKSKFTLLQSIGNFSNSFIVIFKMARMFDVLVGLAFVVPEAPIIEDVCRKEARLSRSGRLPLI